MTGNSCPFHLLQGAFFMSGNCKKEAEEETTMGAAHGLVVKGLFFALCVNGDYRRRGVGLDSMLHSYNSKFTDLR